jgi:peptidoglycan L-alanyl-D-glutamate endopeptidase CwlK
MNFLITDGMRTFAEQDELFHKGRKLVNGNWIPKDPVHKTGIVTNAPGGLSNHNYGLAFDSYPVISGKVFTSIPDHSSLEFRNRFKAIQKAIGEDGEAVGLFWGGRWTNPFDPPHLQLFPQTEMKPRTCLEIFRANGDSLAAVWAEVDKRLS